MPRHVLVKLNPAADDPPFRVTIPNGTCASCQQATMHGILLDVRDVTHLPVVPIGPFLPSCTLAVWRTSSQT